MNERIKEFEDQASQYASRETTDLDEWEFIFRKKFAELIVRECLAIAKNREDEFESAGLLEQSNAVGNVAYRISRQFGVNR
jgi:hypothetical protein